MWVYFCPAVEHRHPLLAPFNKQNIPLVSLGLLKIQLAGFFVTQSLIIL